MARTKTPDIRPFTRQFYRGTKRYLVLGLIQTVIITAANLLISWLLQQMLDLASGVDTGFTLQNLILLAAVFIGMIILCYGLEYLGRPRFISRGMAQYREYACERLSGFTNLYVDTSSSMATPAKEYGIKPYVESLTPDHTAALIRKWGAEKVLFGSDYPMWSQEADLTVFFSMGLTEEENRMILSENAKRVFSIS